MRFENLHRVCVHGRLLQVVLAKLEAEVFSCPAVVFHGLALAVLVQCLHRVLALVNGIFPVPMAALSTQQDYETILFTLLSVASAEDVLMMVL